MVRQLPVPILPRCLLRRIRMKGEKNGRRRQKEGMSTEKGVKKVKKKRHRKLKHKRIQKGKFLEKRTKRRGKDEKKKEKKKEEAPTKDEFARRRKGDDCAMESRRRERNG